MIPPLPSPPGCCREHASRVGILALQCLTQLLQQAGPRLAHVRALRVGTAPYLRKAWQEARQHRSKGGCAACSGDGGGGGVKVGVGWEVGGAGKA